MRRKFALELGTAFPIDLHEKKKDRAPVTWKRPTEGWSKINTDGSVISAINQAAIGGVIRDNRGKWVLGFAKKLGNVSVTFAELVAARKGLDIAWKRRIPKIILEVDSEIVVSLITKVNTESHPFGTIIEDCRRLLGMPWESRVLHTRREGNQCADAMACKGHMVHTNMLIFESPLVELLEEDSLN